jgi:GH25 family lysozyme M1 (1,4-beta-N-acetylmuramidase)
VTVQRIGGSVAFSCDGCSETTDETDSQFGEAWDEARAAGWVSARDEDGEYEHYCPECARRLGID